MTGETFRYSEDIFFFISFFFSIYEKNTGYYTFVSHNKEIDTRGVYRVEYRVHCLKPIIPSKIVQRINDRSEEKRRARKRRGKKKFPGERERLSVPKERRERSGGWGTMARRIEQKSGRRWDISLSLSPCLSPSLSGLRNRSRKGGGGSGRVLRGKRPAKSGALLACVRACVRRCVRACVRACGSWCAPVYRGAWMAAGHGRGVRW